MGKVAADTVQVVAVKEVSGPLYSVVVAGEEIVREPVLGWAQGLAERLRRALAKVPEAEGGGEA